ncbi:hypothetical protein CHARACLAT_006864 [Characodon lateralis]|uniref:Uncharacterized protein n=1 Tax=Characodon lateralis TaxID=208331 RepID=A0ABU7CLH7_9TELE|nr:hypothetical protein [Characodon lateralis]
MKGCHMSGYAASRCMLEFTSVCFEKRSVKGDNLVLSRGSAEKLQVISDSFFCFKESPASVSCLNTKMEMATFCSSLFASCICFLSHDKLSMFSFLFFFTSSSFLFHSEVCPRETGKQD